MIYPMGRADLTTVKGLCKAAEQQGFIVTKSKSGHWKVHRGRRLVCSIPSSPSDYHSLRNSVSNLRKAGFKES